MKKLHSAKYGDGAQSLDTLAMEVLSASPITNDIHLNNNYQQTCLRYLIFKFSIVFDVVATHISWECYFFEEEQRMGKPLGSTRQVTQCPGDPNRLDFRRLFLEWYVNYGVIKHNRITLRKSVDSTDVNRELGNMHQKVRIGDRQEVPHWFRKNFSFLGDASFPRKDRQSGI